MTGETRLTLLPPALAGVSSHHKRDIQIEERAGETFKIAYWKCEKPIVNGISLIL